ncbi:MAG: DUF6634 family protein [Aliihoeflea sp.]|uniref:DUF6634 family protein n=1 Tax=Aliihoeflea sp. TaxID=2608088 RepID=UPI004037EAB4
MVTFTNGNPQHESLAKTAERLSALAADLRAIAHGQLPEEFLAGSAPTLDWWSPAVRPSVCLEGLVSGHPVLVGQDRAIRTSELWHLDQEAGWARTYSRWYRLGQPAPALGQGTGS